MLDLLERGPHTNTSQPMTVLSTFSAEFNHDPESLPFRSGSTAQKRLAECQCSCGLTFSTGLGAPKGTESAIIKNKTLGTGIKLMWMGIKLPVVKNREFVVLQWVDQPSGPVSALVRTSLPPAFAAQVRPVTRSRVRGHMETQCTVIAEVPGNPE